MQMPTEIAELVSSWIFPIIAVADLLVVAVLLIPAIADIRDKTIESGLFGLSPSGRGGRAYRRREMMRVLPVLRL